MYSDTELTEFLTESNAIEGVYDPQSLIQARAAWDFINRQTELNIPNVLATHRYLMEGKLPPEYLGRFRECQVWVGGREGLPSPLIPSAMENWVIEAKTITPDPKALHIQYERIHPFIDGNGRTGRILMNWMRLKQGLPILIVRAKDVKHYYEWFR